MRIERDIYLRKFKNAAKWLRSLPFSLGKTIVDILIGPSSLQRFTIWVFARSSTNGRWTIPNTMLALWILLVIPTILFCQKVQDSHTIQKGTLCFFDFPQNGKSKLDTKALTTFTKTQNLYAALNPNHGIMGIPDGVNKYWVRIFINGNLASEVEIELPPVCEFQRVLALPIFPAINDNHIPQLTAAVKASVQQATGEASLTINIYLRKYMYLLATGTCTVDAAMGTREYPLLDEPNAPIDTSSTLDREIWHHVAATLKHDFPCLPLQQLTKQSSWIVTNQRKVQLCKGAVAYTVLNEDGVCYKGSASLAITTRKGKTTITGSVFPNLALKCE
jgi:hypothetical protein